MVTYTFKHAGVAVHGGMRECHVEENLKVWPLAALSGRRRMGEECITLRTSRVFVTCGGVRVDV